MFAAALIAIVAAQLDANSPVGAARAPSPVVFHLLPTVSASAECTGTAITGTKGEAITVARTSSAYCEKRDKTLVLIAANLPRVEEHGILVESAATNLALRSQEFDSASWSKDGSAGKTPTVAANAAVAPDGTTTAERIDFPAIAGGDFSRVHQSVTATAAAYTGSFWLRADAQTTIPIFFMQSGANNFAVMVTVGTTWTRFSLPNKTLTATSWSWKIGWDDVSGGEIATITAPPYTARSIYIWGAQVETGAYATSHVPTLGTTAARTAESASLVAPKTVGTRPAFMATIRTKALAGSTQFYWMQVYNSGVDRWNLKVREAALENEYISGAAFSGSHVSTMANGTDYNVALSYDGTNLRSCLGAACTNTARSFTPSATFNEIHIGHASGGVQLNGHLRNVRACKAVSGCK